MKGVRWLLGELDGLVRQDILSPEAAGRLREHYGAVAVAGDRRLRELFFAVIGALLVGGGVILLLAHNWAALSRPVRTVLAFVPLIAAQGLVCFTLLRRRGSPAWREGAAIGVVFASAAAIGLIGQTYHIPGNLHGFLGVWMLLTLPAIYLLEATSVALVYLIGIVFWLGTGGEHAAGRSLYWLWLVAVAPYLVLRLRPRGGVGTVIGWTLALTVPAGALITAHDLAYDAWAPIQGLTLGAFVTLGVWLRRQRGDDGTGFSLLDDPLLVAGTLGGLILAFVLSVREVWADIGGGGQGFAWRPGGEAGLLQFAFGILAVGLGVIWWRTQRRDPVLALLGLLPLLVVAAWILAVGSGLGPWMLAMTFNLFLSALGIVAIVWGVRRRRMDYANGGLGIVALLLVVRFFDSDLPLVARGLVFVAVGIGFLVANRWLGRRAASDRSEAAS